MSSWGIILCVMWLYVQRSLAGEEGSKYILQNAYMFARCISKRKQDYNFMIFYKMQTICYVICGHNHVKIFKLTMDTLLVHMYNQFKQALHSMVQTVDWMKKERKNIPDLDCLAICINSETKKQHKSRTTHCQNVKLQTTNKTLLSKCINILQSARKWSLKIQK